MGNRVSRMRAGARQQALTNVLQQLPEAQRCRSSRLAAGWVGVVAQRRLHKQQAQAPNIGVEGVAVAADALRVRAPVWKHQQDAQVQGSICQ